MNFYFHLKAVVIMAVSLDPDSSVSDDDSAMYRRLSERVSAAAEDETLAAMFSGALADDEADAGCMTGLVPKSDLELVREMVRDEAQDDDGLLKWDAPKKKSVIDIDAETGRLSNAW